MKYTLSALLVLSVTSGAFAQSFFDGFEGATGTGAGASGTVTSGANVYDWFNLSVGGPGTASWNVQTNSTVFPAHEGISFLSANFNSSTGANAISNWIMAPVRTFNNGDSISFFTRTSTTPTFPDRLRLRLSTSGASTNTADFGTILLTVNEGLNTADYPNAWTQFSATLSGLNGPTSGRFAFHYDVPNGGPGGVNSDFIGIDSLNYTAVPEPATMLVLGAAAAAAAARRRRK